MKKISMLILSFLLIFCAAFSVGLATLNVKADDAGGESSGESSDKHVEMYPLAPENQSLMQSYVIKTKNGKLIVMDGGIDGAGYNSKPYITAALRAIAGVGEGEYFEVEAWFLSHAHKDHFRELYKVLNSYTAESNFKINNFYFDFPDYGTASFPATNGDSPQLEELKTALDNYAKVNSIKVENGSYYEDLNGAVINAQAVANGLDIVIDEVRFEVLQTWDSTDGGDVNNSSLVVRMWADGQSVMFLHDLGIAGGNRLLRTYSAAQLKSDIVQMAHHGQSGVSEDVYKAINATAHIWNTPLWVWNNTKDYPIDSVRKWVNNGEDFTKTNRFNIVACLYGKYPSNSTKVEAWEKALDAQRIILPYQYDGAEDLEGTSTWSLVSGTAKGKASDNGWICESEEAFSLISTNKVWVDKFGIAFRISSNNSKGVIIGISAQDDLWYEKSYGGIGIKAVPVSDLSSADVETKISVLVGGEEYLSYSTYNFYWEDEHSYSVNYLYLGKTNDGWFVNINDQIITLDAHGNLALDEELEKFSDYIGYVQFENLGGALKYTFDSVLFGAPTGAIEAPDSFSSFIVGAPNWTSVWGDELCGWAPAYQKRYTVSSDIAMPLKGMDVTLRMAHGDAPTQNIIAFTSLYEYNWYAGTYTIALRFAYEPAYGDDMVMLSLMIYDQSTDSAGIEPIKMTEMIDDFKWFKSNRIQIIKTRGEWKMLLNEREVFGSQLSTEGKSLNEYISGMASYFDNGVFLQMYGAGNLAAEDYGSNDGIVVESMAKLQTEDTGAISINNTYQNELKSTEFKINSETTIDLKKLFNVADDASGVEYFATLGKIEDGVWKYTASAKGSVVVSFTALYKGVLKEVRITLNYSNSGSQSEKSCSSGISAGHMSVMLALFAASAVILRKKRSEN